MKTIKIIKKFTFSILALGISTLTLAKDNTTPNLTTPASSLESIKQSALSNDAIKSFIQHAVQKGISVSEAVSSLVTKYQNNPSILNTIITETATLFPQSIVEIMTAAAVAAPNHINTMITTLIQISAKNPQLQRAIQQASNIAAQNIAKNNNEPATEVEAENQEIASPNTPPPSNNIPPPTFTPRPSTPTPVSPN